MPAPELVSAASGDTPDGSRGALRLTVTRQPGFDYYSHNSGAVVRLSPVVPVGSTIRVDFSAKLESGARWLGITRLWGGGQSNVKISRTWQRYTAYVTLGFDTDGIVFSTIPYDRDTLQASSNGQVLIDDVVVRVVDAVEAAAAKASVRDENLAANGDLDPDIAPWYGQRTTANAQTLVPAPEMIAHETRDTAGSAGAVRLTVQRQANHQYYLHATGAICPLARYVPKGSVIRVRFSAKSLSGPRWLSLVRLWGGSNIESFALNETWQRYEGYLALDYDTDGVAFSILDAAATGLREQVDGTVLIDEVDIRVVPARPEGSQATTTGGGVAPTPTVPPPERSMDWEPTPLTELRRLRDDFRWETTQPLPPSVIPAAAPRTAEEMPLVHYVEVYVRNANELRELDEMGVHYDLAPLFDEEWPDVPEDMSVTTPFVGDPEDGGGQFAFALMSADTYNAIRAASLGLDGEEAADTYAAMILRDVPEAARAPGGPPSAVSWDYLLAGGMRQFAVPDAEYTDHGPVVPPLLEDLPNQKATYGIGRRLRKWVRKVADVGRKAVNGVRAGFGSIANLVSPDAHVSFDIAVGNRAVDFGPVPQRAWDYGGSYGNALTLKGATVHVMGRGKVALYPTQLDEKGHGSVTVMPRVRTRICVVADSPAAKIEQGFVRPARHCWGWFRPERGSPAANKKSYITKEYEWHALAQFIDAREYATRVLGFTPRKATVLSGKLSSAVGKIGASAFVPCLAANNHPVAIANAAAAALDTAGFVLQFTPIVPLPPIPLGTMLEFVLANDIVLAREDSRETPTHEYGHFLLCDLLARENPASFERVWSDVIRNMNNVNSEVKGLNEGFADWFAAQVAGGTDYFGASRTTHSPSGGYFYQAGATLSGFGMEENVGAPECGPAVPAFPACVSPIEPRALNGNENVARAATLFHDMIDCSQKDVGCAGNGRTNGGSYLSTTATTQLAATPVLESVDDERIMLTPRQLIDGIRAFARAGGALDRATLYRVLSDVMYSAGHTMVDVCRLFALHSADGKCPSWVPQVVVVI